ncbi:MAG: protein tyrosine phosphatase family protein [Caldilineaceae bacterium]|nr:protein tyrosine phosphatase family protein [Caldilineaceae bacterium]MCB0143193.1 protein tyrosine phosphatase family protein [Caldilineaceae bacterium]
MAEPSLTDIYNFLPIDAHWATAGQPTVEQFAAIQASGYEVIINLAMPDSPRAVPSEAELVGAYGIAYIAIPVVWEAPTPADFTAFCTAMTANQAKKRFVHCIANMRVSAFTFLYRVLALGVPVEEAHQALLQIWEPNPVWRQFIDEQLATYLRLNNTTDAAQ